MRSKRTHARFDELGILQDHTTNLLPVKGGLAVFGFPTVVAPAATVNAIHNSAADVPVTANDYTATGNTVNFTLNLAPITGTDLTEVSSGQFLFTDPQATNNPRRFYRVRSP